MDSILNIWEKYQNGTATITEKEILLKALKDDNEEITSIVAANWEAAEELLEDIKEKKHVWNVVSAKTKAGKGPIKNYFRYGVAASIAILATFSLLWSTSKGQTIVVEVANGEPIKEVMLPDGSKVWVNCGSSISYLEEFDSDIRDVELNGNAFFEVERDEDRPFVITANTVEVEVLGTSFDVYSYVDETPTISVATGRVKVNHLPSETSIRLRKNQQAHLDEMGQLVKAEVNSNNIIKWREHILYFEGTLLVNVIKKLERQYGVVITCDNLELLNSRIRAEYKNETLTTVMDDLTFLTNSMYTLNGNEITLKQKD